MAIPRVPKSLDVVIIGAGPYGLGAAAVARERGLSYKLFGKLGAFWKDHMPRGMFLRTHGDSHVDPFEKLTFEAYASIRGLQKAETDPLPLATFIEYLEWFAERHEIVSIPQQVVHLTREPIHGGFFVLTDAHESYFAKRVVIATGMGAFRYVPPEFAELPPSHASHTADLTDLSLFSGQRIAIIGGRQSAFETAAILGERSPDIRIDVIHRHETPKFVESDWQSMDEMLKAASLDPRWYPELPEEEKARYRSLAYRSGRHQLEAWLWPRLQKPFIRFREKTSVKEMKKLDDGVWLQLSDGQEVKYSRLILATGYQIAVDKLAFLDRESILAGLAQEKGSPILSGGCESSIPGLHVLGALAMASFGYPLGFVKGVPLAGQLLRQSWTAKDAFPAH